MTWMPKPVRFVQAVRRLAPFALTGLLLLTCLQAQAQGTTHSPEKMLQQADALMQQGQIPDAAGMYRQVMDQLQGTENPMQFIAMARLGEALLQLKQPETAGQLMSEAVNGLMTAGRYEQGADLLVRIGNVQIRFGDAQSALQTFQWVSGLKDELKDDRYLIVGRNGEALAYRIMKRLDEAEKAYSDALAVARRMGDRFRATQVQSGLAGLQWQRGNQPEACRRFAIVARDYQALKHPRAATGVYQEMRRIGCGQ